MCGWPGYTTTLTEENDSRPVAGERRIKSLAAAVIEALGKPTPPAKAYIRFSTMKTEYDEKYGKEKTDNRASAVYPPISMRSVFIQDEWDYRYDSGEFFKDKIILIGPAFARFQDNHQTPVGQLFGPSSTSSPSPAEFETTTHTARSANGGAGSSGPASRARLLPPF